MKSQVHGEESKIGDVEHYTLADAGKQGDKYDRTTKAIGEYVGTEYGHQMKVLVLQGKEETLKELELPENPKKLDELKWGKQYDLYLRKVDRYKDEKAKVFTIILATCEDPMKHRVECHEDYETAEQDADVVALLKIVKELAYGSNDRKYPVRQAVEAWVQLLFLRQDEKEDLTAYYKRFISLVDGVERAYGTISPTVVAEKDKKYSLAGDTKKKKMVEDGRQAMMAMMFMRGAHRGFRPLLNDLESDFAFGAQLYPSTVADALQVLSEYTSQRLYKSIMRKKKHGYEKGQKEISFLQMSKAELRRKGLCFTCGKKWSPGHECDSNGENGQESGQQGNVNLQIPTRRGWSD